MMAKKKPALRDPYTKAALAPAIIDPPGPLPDVAVAAQEKLARHLIAFVLGSMFTNEPTDTELATKTATAMAAKYFRTLGPRQVDAMLTGE